jgi:hypothetical protein
MIRASLNQLVLTSLFSEIPSTSLYMKFYSQNHIPPKLLTPQLGVLPFSFCKSMFKLHIRDYSSAFLYFSVPSKVKLSLCIMKTHAMRHPVLNKAPCHEDV